MPHSERNLTSYPKPSYTVSAATTVVNMAEKFIEKPSLSGDGPHDISLGEIINISVTAEEERGVLRKIDLCILPLMGFAYLLQLMDKTTLSYATLLGLIKDTKLHGTDYSWCSSIFYFGYLVFSYPSSYLIVRFPVGKYLSVSVFIWAVVLMSHAACNTFGTLMVVRFLLGAAEAAVAPGFSLIIGMFYKRKEQPLRQGAWFLGNGIGNTVGGLIAFAIGKISGSHLESWRIMFLILGGFTLAYSAVLFLVLPDLPTKAVFLKKHERAIAVHRVLENKTGALDESSYRPEQMIEAFKDPQAWLLVAYTFCINIPNGGVGSYASLIIEAFGFSDLESLLAQMPVGGSQIMFLVIACLSATFFRSRLVIMMLVVSICLMGAVLVYALDPIDRTGRLTGIVLVAAIAANIPFSLSLISSNVAGFTKKATVTAMLFMAYSVGNIVGPQYFITKQAPRYETGLRSVLAGLSLSIIFLGMLLAYYVWENCRRDKICPVTESHASEILAEELSNLTDCQIPSFRYVL